MYFGKGLRCCGELSDCQPGLGEDSLASGSRRKLRSCGCCWWNGDSAAGKGRARRSRSGRGPRSAV